jgi:hypothetical protein
MSISWPTPSIAPRLQGGATIQIKINTMFNFFPLRAESALRVTAFS